MFNPDTLRKDLAELSDEVLLETNPEDLTDEARAIYEEEFAARGIAWPSDADPTQIEAAPTDLFPQPDDAALVRIERYQSFSEARFAYTLLRQEQIPVWITGPKIPGQVGIDPNAPIDLVTLPDHLEAAQQLLNPEFTDEELAAQAEEAGEVKT